MTLFTPVDWVIFSGFTIHFASFINWLVSKTFSATASVKLVYSTFIRPSFTVNSLNSLEMSDSQYTEHHSSIEAVQYNGTRSFSI